MRLGGLAMELKPDQFYVFGVWYHLTNECMYVFEQPASSRTVTVIFHESFKETFRFQYPLDKLICTRAAFRLNRELHDIIEKRAFASAA